jgi:small multidrug resistance pump
MKIILLCIFWTMQVIAQVIFKYGSITKGVWLTSFIVGNVFGASSIWLLMLLYKYMNVNIALALSMGGAFLLTQIVLALVFHSNISFLQTIGIFLISSGMFMIVIK